MNAMQFFIRPRFFWLLITLMSGWICNPVFAAKPTHKHIASKHRVRVKTPEPVIKDSTSEAWWRKKLPWFYRDTGLSVYRDTLIRPLFKKYALGTENLFKRGGFIEAVLPRGRSLQEYAWDFEALCGQTGIRVLEGHEFDPPEEKLEYQLQSGSFPPFPLRLTLGKTVLAGSARMAFIMIGLDTLTESAAKKLLEFPFPLTFVLKAGDSTPIPAHWVHLPPDKEVMLELPMEPVNYPYIRPGPGALFIHQKPAEMKALMKARLKAYPSAKGFATTFGDRAIENRPLLENVLHFTTDHNLIFIDLTASPRSLTASLALQTGASVFSARVQEPDSAVEQFEAVLLKRCERASKTGEGIWVLRYFPALPGILGKALSRNREYFTGIGLEWVTVVALRKH